MTRAVLDANVLYGSVARDLMLRLADQKLFQPLWTDEVLSEVERAIRRNRPATPDQLAHLMTSLRLSFPNAAVA
ncbi:MAG: hypothetical protein WD557_05305 [Dehalococcoidia bacterium]